VILNFNHRTEFHAQLSTVVNSSRGPSRRSWPLIRARKNHVPTKDDQEGWYVHRAFPPRDTLNDGAGGG
jgi:hypothetical protein